MYYILNIWGDFMNNIKRWQEQLLGERVVKSLQKNEFHSIYVESKEEAVAFIMYHISRGTVVGIGGSTTIEDLNIDHNIIEKGGTLLRHSDGVSEEEKFEIMRKELLSDVYLCSTNALTLDGYLINVDGAGNRVAAMNFGPRKIIIVAGVNKIVKNEVEAAERLRFTACPLNNKRLNLQNPCTSLGVCTDCNSSKRICRIYTTVKRKPLRSDITVIVVGEHLGF